MEDKDLRNIWKNTPGEININSQQILLEMNLEIQEMEESIKKRNLLEIMACIFIIIFFSVKACFFDNWIESLGAILAVLGAVIIIAKLLMVQNSQKRADLSNSFKNQMLEDRKYLRKEQKLLENVLYWYILPIFIPILVMIFSNGFSWVTSLINIPLMIGFGYYIYHINQKAAKKFDPILNNLDMTIKEMEE